MTNILMRNKNGYQSKVAKINQKRSVFPIRYSRKQTMNASFITPIMCKKIVPGETLYINLQNFSRLNTQVTCPIDNLTMETFFFYAPERIVWDDFRKFIGEKIDENSTNNYLTPQVEIPAEKNTAGSLFNLLSHTRLNKKAKVSAIPFRIHNAIFNRYFRDTDCQSAKTVKRDSSDDDINLYDLYRIHKSRDYFTNSTRDMQAGEPINLPLGTTAPVVGNGMTLGLTNGGGQYGYAGLYADNEQIYNLGTRFAGYGAPVGQAIAPEESGNIINTLGVTPDATKSGLIALLNQATAATIDTLRQGIMVQEYKEALNRGGQKYTDIMHNVYGVTLADNTIQEPIYLGGTSTPFFTNPVVQTSATDSNTPQGNIAGFGTATENGKVINASFEEFGWIIGYCVIKAQPQYQQGLDRQWTEKDIYEYFNPYFNNLSDQIIKRQEIFLEDYDATDQTGQLLNDKVFGYIGRNDHLRYFKNEIAGELNSEYQYTLDSWHYAEKFENAPENNASFMEDKTYEILDRTMAYIWEDEQQTIKAPQIIADFLFTGMATEPIPTNPVPKISALM